MKVKKLSFLWQKKGELKVKSSDHESSKKGDDAYFRLGLILSGEAPSIPFFAPAWIKKSREVLKLPSDKLLYLTVGSKFPAGKSWESPYSSSISSLSMASTEKEGWMHTSQEFAKGIKLSGSGF